ncbi:MAG TPA: hypothetical protein VGO25_04290 [Rhodanobacteraceae bacterium]|nr:hypothetical protein [Rhodanobacteraceae bacterium]
MKARISIIGATLATLFAASAFATQQDASSTMTVDSDAPVRATLLPTVSIDATEATSAANPARMRIADTAPYEVTLLPTVHVKALSSPALAVTLLPTVYVTAEADAVSTEPVADVEGGTNDLRVDDIASPSSLEKSFGLRTRTMPR